MLWRWRGGCSAMTCWMVRSRSVGFLTTGARKSFSCTCRSRIFGRPLVGEGRSGAGTSKVVTVARHLGSHLGEKASFAHKLGHDDGFLFGGSAVCGMNAGCREVSSGASSSVVWSTLRCPASRRSAIQKHNTWRSRRPWSVLREELWRVRRRAEEYRSRSAPRRTRRSRVSGDWHLAMLRLECEDSSGRHGGWRIFGSLSCLTEGELFSAWAVM